MDLRRLIAVARGDEPADVLLTNARVVNVFTGETEEAAVALGQGRVAGVGDYRDGQQIIDLRGQYLAPAFIDAHVHVESSYLHITEYARAIVPRGTQAVVTDFHEIANVCGIPGVRAMLDATRGLPLDVFLAAPSCVPATSLETAGAALGPADLKRLFRWRQTVGLGEVMCFPDVVAGDAGALAKIAAAGDRPVEGHAPGLVGKTLNAYVAAGPASCHETTTEEEGRDKLRRGVRLMIREGTSEKNLEALLPLVTDASWPQCILVVDDRDCRDLLHDGDMDAVVRKAVRLGMDPVRAIQLATINPARHFHLGQRGAVAPGYIANLIVLGDLRAVDVQMVFFRGRLVARAGQPLFRAPVRAVPALRNTVRMKPFRPRDMTLASPNGAMPVIHVVPGQILTRESTEVPLRSNGYILSDPQRDLLKLVVVERHHATGNIGRAMVKGFGLKRGALATSVAHDSHNIVAVGVSDEDICAAVDAVAQMQGGLAVTDGGRVLAALALPLAGLLSDEPLEKVAAQVEELERAARELGSTLPAPFAVLSFLALPVIPALRLTDRGLVDVLRARLIV